MRNLRHEIGIKLLKFGAELLFDNDKTKEHFKNHVNANTLLGSHAESGGHIHGNMTPMNEYDIQSVINVLKHAELENDCYNKTSKISYYSEKWCS